MDVKREPCSFSMYEQMRRLPDGTITLANTEYTRNYIRECEAALCFKDRYCKGEIVCLGIEEEQRNVTEENVCEDKGTSINNKEVRRTRRKKEVTEKVYDMVKPELLARVDEIISSERGMKYYIKTEGWQHLSRTLHTRWRCT